jgi:hypothetical protein
MKHIYVVTGGTLVHVRPHFSLCAAAYGQVGSEIHDGLTAGLAARRRVDDFRVHLVRTRMAGPSPAETVAHLQELGVPPAPETNADLRTLVQAVTARAETAALVMAAAVCDFEPVELTVTGETGPQTTTDFGKGQKRLHHVRSATLALRPSEKLVDLVKSGRPEVCLVTFKTTAGLLESDLRAQAMQNLQRSRSDLVFANDIQHRLNLVVTATGEILQGADRRATVRMLCDQLLSRVVECRPR